MFYCITRLQYVQTRQKEKESEVENDVTMTLNEWIRKFKPILEEERYSLKEFYRITREQIKEFGGKHHFWTVMCADDSTDDDREFIVEGLHSANSNYHLATEVPWEEDKIYTIYMEDSYTIYVDRD